jgi:hypothetical protein
MAAPPPLPRTPPLPGTPAPPGPAPLEPLGYAASLPHAEGRRALPFAWGIFFWSLAVLLAWLAFMLLVLPGFAATFGDFGIELPASTRALFATRTALLRGGAVVLLAIPVGLGFVAGPFSPGGRRAVRMLAALVVGLLILFTVLGVAEPLTQLMQGIGTAGGGRP